jgi:hypothetical protein
LPPARHKVANIGIDWAPEIGYQPTMINTLPTFASTMMMPFCNSEAVPFGM